MIFNQQSLHHSNKLLLWNHGNSHDENGLWGVWDEDNLIKVLSLPFLSDLLNIFI